MDDLAFTLILLTGSGLLSALMRKRPLTAQVIGAGGRALAGVMAMIPAAHTVVTGQILSLASPVGDEFLPLRDLSLSPITAWLILLIAPLAIGSALYGNRPAAAVAEEREPGSSWLAGNLALAGLLLSALTQQPVLLLAACEVLAVSSYCCLRSSQGPLASRARRVFYLFATHGGATCLFFFQRAHAR